MKEQDSSARAQEIEEFARQLLGENEEEDVEPPAKRLKRDPITQEMERLDQGIFHQLRARY